MSEIKIGELEKLAKVIEAKRKQVSSSDDYSETEWAAIDSYNFGLTEAAEIVREFTAEHGWRRVEDGLPKADDEAIEYFVTVFNRGSGKTSTMILHYFAGN